jgi:hypothetical protein
MKYEHIIGLLENDRFPRLTNGELQQIDAHIAQCVDCRQAHAAARIAGALLRARAGQSIEPPPFFTTRMMAAIREKQSSPSLLDILSLWKTARALIVSGAAAAGLLAALTFLTPQPQSESSALAVLTSDYSAERVVFVDDSSRANDNFSNGQVMDVVLTPEGRDASNEK